MAANERIIGKTYAGQGWIELHGSFTFDELHSIAQKVEESYRKVKNGSKD